MSSDSAADSKHARSDSNGLPSDSKSTGAPSGDPSLHPSSRNESQSGDTRPHGLAVSRTGLPGAGHRTGHSRAAEVAQ